MTNKETAPVGAVLGPGPTPRFHHIGIQTTDLENSVGWYRELFGCDLAWTLDRFSELTRSRLPGIRALAELVVGDLRLHVFERPGRPSDPEVSAVQFQHLCLSVASPEDLVAMRDRCLELRRSGRYTFSVDDPPTEIVVDADGVESFYAFDVDGLELELSYAPGHRS